MKSVIVIAFLSLMSISLLAQSEISTPKNFLTGGLGFNTSNVDNPFTASVNQNRYTGYLSVGYGRQFTKHWSVIGSVTYDRTLTVLTLLNFENMEYERRSKSQGVRFTNAYRYTFNPQDKFQFSLQSSLTYNYSFSNYIDESEAEPSEIRDYRYFQTSIGPQLSYLISPKFRIISNIGGFDLKYSMDSDNAKVFTAGFSLSSFISIIRLEYLF